MGSIGAAGGAGGRGGSPGPLPTGGIDPGCGGSNDGGGRFDMVERYPTYRLLPGRPVRSRLVPATSDPQVPDVEIAVVTMRFDAADPGPLVAVLAKYIVLTRMQPGCRNVDLCASVTQPGRYLVIQKWDSVEAQRTHFDSEVMVEMATACTGLLSTAPDIDLWDGPSAHDLA